MKKIEIYYPHNIDSKLWDQDKNFYCKADILLRDKIFDQVREQVFIRLWDKVYGEP